jgi:hypothetical protein
MQGLDELQCHLLLKRLLKEQDVKLEPPTAGSSDPAAAAASPPQVVLPAEVVQAAADYYGQERVYLAKCQQHIIMTACACVAVKVVARGFACAVPAPQHPNTRAHTSPCCFPAATRPAVDLTADASQVCRAVLKTLLEQDLGSKVFANLEALLSPKAGGAAAAAATPPGAGAAAAAAAAGSIVPAAAGADGGTHVVSCWRVLVVAAGAAESNADARLGQLWRCANH